MIQNYGSRFKIQNYGSRYIRYHLLQSITLSNPFLSQLSLSLNAGFDLSLSHKTRFLSLKFTFSLSNPGILNTRSIGLYCNTIPKTLNIWYILQI
ncbi:hypothetical protein HanPI659440_Chr04g0172671 [Helianthus annuus]|nr:hypothetical protein HanPI659440_Chr04g0172671 [Helianthus annuus]